MAIAGGIEGATRFIGVLLKGKGDHEAFRGTLAFGFAAQSGSDKITAADTSDVQRSQHGADDAVLTTN
jgi:hypothetical protein